MRKRHIQDVATVSVFEEYGGVRIEHVGFDLGVTSDEARQFARILVQMADRSDKIFR